MRPELNEQGWVKNPIRRNWQNGSVFVMPPRWWHPHHNESDQDAMVVPVQDAWTVLVPENPRNRIFFGERIKKCTDIWK